MKIAAVQHGSGLRWMIDTPDCVATKNLDSIRDSYPSCAQDDVLKCPIGIFALQACIMQTSAPWKAISEAFRSLRRNAQKHALSNSLLFWFE